MQWKKYPEAVEFVRKVGDQYTDYEIAKVLQKKYPEEYLTYKSVQYCRQSMGVAKSNYFRQKYEAQAGRNLQRLITRLKKG